MFWTSNRPNNYGPAPITPDTPWYLFFSQLNQAFNANAPAGFNRDWRYEPISGGLQSWWDLLAANAAYPAPPFVANVKNNFPSEAGDIPMGATSPVVAGIINPGTERHATPALTQDDDPAKNNPTTWLFWQGAVYKTTAGGQSFGLDTRTFYTPLLNGQPNPPAGIPYSFLNDPNLPKFSPRPIILTTNGGPPPRALFSARGAAGR